MQTLTKKNWRARKFYKKLNSYLATAYSEGFCEGEGASVDDQLTAWQWLHDKGVAYQLQGWFGRTAQELIRNEVIED